jgi:hypothetical protein
MDKNTGTMFNANIHDPKLIKMETKFLYNTKITSSAIGADKWFEKMRNKNHPQGRIISRHEMVQVLLGEPQVFTNLVFEMLSTAPLSEHPGTVKHPTVNARCTDKDLELSRYRRQCGNDSIIFIIHPDQIRRELRGSLPQWRQFMTSQVIIINDTFFSKVSLDKVTVYGMRPPELRVSIWSIGNYYRWFIRSSKSYTTDKEELAKWFSVNVQECQWVDGLGNQVFLRANALTSGELEAFIHANNSSVSPEGTTMFAMLRTMISFFRLFGFTLQHEVQTHFPNANPSALHRWECLQQNFVDFSKASTDDIQPIPVFSNITPNNTS